MEKIKGMRRKRSMKTQVRASRMRKRRAESGSSRGDKIYTPFQCLTGDMYTSLEGNVTHVTQTGHKSPMRRHSSSPQTKWNVREKGYTFIFQKNSLLLQGLLYPLLCPKNSSSHRLPSVCKICLITCVCFSMTMLSSIPFVSLLSLN